MSQSDPINSSLGPPGIKVEDLDPDMIFELKQRSMKPLTFEDVEEIKDNFNSIKVAEAIIGAKMAGPNDPAELAKYITEVSYKIADSDDEDEDTRETRRSIKTAEKMLKRRFFVNPKDKREFHQKVMEGRIS